MTRSSFRPIASVGLVTAVLAYVGCSKGPETLDRPVASTPGPTATEPQGPVTPEPARTVPAPVETAGTEPAKTEPAKTEPINVEPAKTVPAKDEPKVPRIIADWSARPPVAVLVISGQQDGYPDPCGCTEGQLGGLGRRYHLCQMLEAKGWPLVKVDLGDLTHYRGDSRGGKVQEKIKFGIILKALAAMRYDAVALGPEDLKLGIVDTLVALLNAREPRVLAANLKAVDKDLGEAIQATRTVKAGGLTFGITAVLDPAAYRSIRDDDTQMLAVRPADEVLPGVLDELRKEAQVAVLMVQGPRAEAKRLAEKFPRFDVVIGTSEFDDPDEKPETLNQGRTLLINNVGRRGKYVGLVAFRPADRDRMEFRRQPLEGPLFHQADEMKLLIDKEYQDMLKSEGVVENFPRVSRAASYVGAQACQECHPRTFARWETTKHARAYEPLTNPRRNREFDAECISCHTTGFGDNTGWVSTEKTPLLKGNQCENCHGPGSLHAADPDNLEFRKPPMKMSADWAKSTAFCTKCHDADNSPHFNFDPYYAQIFHKGYDSYDDPKVHRKQPPKVADGAR